MTECEVEMKPPTEVVKATVADTPVALMRLSDIARDAATTLLATAGEANQTGLVSIVVSIAIPVALEANAKLPIVSPDTVIMYAVRALMLLPAVKVMYNDVVVMAVDSERPKHVAVGVGEGAKNPAGKPRLM